MKTLLSKLYGGYLGMNVGIRLGAPVEPALWTAERIERTYGDIRGYVKEYRHFAADDDANGPVFFLRALEDNGGREPTPGDVAEAFLNYTREGIGMIWQGGYGVSTEQTAYMNLLSGIPAPRSGSIRQNGATAAEQIGGQIFIDTWGLTAAGDPDRAARYARTAASVTHDGEGLNGAAFIASAIAAAFTETDMERILDIALAHVPAESRYAAVVRAVRDFRRAHPEEDWKACRRMLEADWGYDRYPGACHIIPNAGVCALALAYGGGDFCRTVEIAAMCGWDTDCNAGNVGTIAGVLCGIGGIPAHYRDPINDELVFSSASGYLNIQDVPTYIWSLAGWVYRLRGEKVPQEVQRHIRPGEIHFDFSLPGSTHGMRVSDPCVLRAVHREGALEVMWDRLERGQLAAVFLKTCYRRQDFSDERYKPCFSPIAYSGQRVRIRAYFDPWKGESVVATPYVRTAVREELLLLEPRFLRQEGEQVFEFTLPDTGGDLIAETGLHLEGNSPRINYCAGRLLIREFEISGPADYRISVGEMPEEFGTVLPFALQRGAWHVENGRLHGMTLGRAEAMTGNYYMRNVRVTGTVCPRNGESHLVTVRVQGTRRGYCGGLGENGRAVILKHRGEEVRVLAEAPFPWQTDREYTLTLAAREDRLTLQIDGEPLCEAEDGEYRWGMAGYALYGTGRAEFGNLSIKE